MQKRYFTVEEANEMIPFLEEAFTRIIQMRHQIGELYQLLETMEAAPQSDDFPIRLPEASPAVNHNRATLKALMGAVQEELEEIRSRGCLVKGIDNGLVDWYGRRDGRDIFLCWRLGEDEVRYWHDTHSGFRGRRPIDELYPPEESEAETETEAGTS